jgi:hypothetical protein
MPSPCICFFPPTLFFKHTSLIKIKTSCQALVTGTSQSAFALMALDFDSNLKVSFEKYHVYVSLYVNTRLRTHGIVPAIYAPPCTQSATAVMDLTSASGSQQPAAVHPAHPSRAMALLNLDTERRGADIYATPPSHDADRASGSDTPVETALDNGRLPLEMHRSTLSGTATTPPAAKTHVQHLKRSFAVLAHEEATVTGPNCFNNPAESDDSDKTNIT